MLSEFQISEGIDSVAQPKLGKKAKKTQEILVVC